jgi:zinc transporter ZupT
MPSSILNASTILNATESSSFNSSNTTSNGPSSDLSLTKPWGTVVLASFLVQMVSFIGIFIVIGTRFAQKLRAGNFDTLFDIIMPSFASGALMALTAFMILPEGIHLLQNSSQTVVQIAGGSYPGRVEKDGTSSWKFGVALIGGFLLPIVFSFIFPTLSDVVNIVESSELPALIVEQKDEEEQNEEQVYLETPAPISLKTMAKDRKSSTTLDSECEANECSHPSHQSESDKTPVDSQAAVLSAPSPPHEEPKSTRRNVPLMLSILLGKSFHNFCDGVFLGNAFVLCGSTIAWTMVAATIYHEMAVELAEFVLLTQVCGLSTWKALMFNFIIGSMIMTGACMILALNLPDDMTGVILTFAAGVFLNITAVECLPSVLGALERRGHKFKDRAIFAGFFVVGAVPIGLVLLTDSSCV